ncbi:hypothetical protein [Sedimentimonas flavescens]|uniref:hypothetical protein n=1 Tax=Sedimentimonas flavescens TaxID=2851012 RepID=UPI0021A85E14|nr:hypothetical protein [Sedimentimonas flavescens]MCT2538768.1 hypothetical protein [Sedimentimonas flavescens]
MFIDAKHKDKHFAAFTVISSENPSVLTKSFRLVGDKLRKEPGGTLLQGRAVVRRVRDLTEFASVLETLQPAQALTYGITGQDDVGITTNRSWQKMNRPSDPIPRTKDHFFWPQGRGILMIDYDPEAGTAPLTVDKVIEALRAVAPALGDVEMLAWPSASSWIKNRDTDLWLMEAGGLRIYVIVDDATDIPRAGQVLSDRLWLAGQGYIKVSSCGSLLERTIVDGSVWQPSRLDFAAGALCEPPLEQLRGKPRLIGGTLKTADTRSMIADLDVEEQAKASRIKQSAKADRRGAAQKIRADWIEARAREIAGDDADDAAVNDARRAAQTALDSAILPKSWVLEVIGADGPVTVTVEEVINDPDRFDGCDTLDPIEPNYDYGRVVGRLYLSKWPKTLHSFARGGRTFRLADQESVITYVYGSLDKAVEETLEVLRTHEQFYDFGDVLAYVDSGRVYAVNNFFYEQMISGSIRYMKPGRKGALIPTEPPSQATSRILSLGRVRKLRLLAGIITAPTVRLDGSIIEQPGYDAATGLYLHLPEKERLAPILRNPTKAELRDALSLMMKPFREFRLASPQDWGALLAALLTAVVRRVLPSAPAFAFDAPVQGSGKTLLAQCIAVLAGAEEPTVTPPLSGRDAEEETRKRLLTFLRSGVPVLIWDNVTGVFNSATLAASLTSPVFSDRVLGASESVTLPNRMMHIFTGNNFQVKGDMARRVIPCRIDTGLEAPLERSFALNPLHLVKEHRQEMVAAALSLIRAAIEKEDMLEKARPLASFEDWDRIVRSTVRWVNEKLAPGDYSDPVMRLREAVIEDPEAEVWRDVLEALWTIFGSRRFTAADVMKELPSRGAFKSEAGRGLRDALDALTSCEDIWTARKLGQAFGYRKDRLVGRLKLRVASEAGKGAKTWELERDGKTGADLRREARVIRIPSHGKRPGARDEEV